MLLWMTPSEDPTALRASEVIRTRDLLNDVVIDSQIVGNGSQADCLVRNAAMDDSIGGS